MLFFTDVILHGPRGDSESKQQINVNNTAGPKHETTLLCN